MLDWGDRLHHGIVAKCLLRLSQKGVEDLPRLPRRERLGAEAGKALIKLAKALQKIVHVSSEFTTRPATKSGTRPAGPPLVALSCRCMDTVDIAVFYLGYAEACSRFQGGGEPIHVSLERGIRSQTPNEWLTLGPSINEMGPAAVVGSFIPLFEALNWATSLDDHVRASWPFEAERWYESIPCGSTVRAVRFARNRVHHQWAQALTLGDADRDLPARVASWVWAWRTELPAGRRDLPGERLYREDLAGEPVIGALGRLTAVFGKALRILHDRGRADSELLVELLPVLDTFDPAEFSRSAVTGRS